MRPGGLHGFVSGPAWLSRCPCTRAHSRCNRFGGPWHRDPLLRWKRLEDVRVGDCEPRGGSRRFRVRLLGAEDRPVGICTNLSLRCSHSGAEVRRHRSIHFTPLAAEQQQLLMVTPVSAALPPRRHSRRVCRSPPDPEAAEVSSPDACGKTRAGRDPIDGVLPPHRQSRVCCCRSAPGSTTALIPARPRSGRLVRDTRVARGRGCWDCRF